MFQIRRAVDGATIDRERERPSFQLRIVLHQLPYFRHIEVTPSEINAMRLANLVLRNPQLGDELSRWQGNHHGVSIYDDVCLDEPPVKLNHIGIGLVRLK